MKTPSITLASALRLTAAGFAICDEIENNGASVELPVDARPLIRFAIDEVGPHLTVLWPVDVAASMTAIEWPGFAVPEGLVTTVSEDDSQLILRPADKPGIPPELARSVEAVVAYACKPA
jgi:hypothetical protein